MEMEQIKNVYKNNGLVDYKLKSPEDLLKVHGIDFKKVSGYNRLDDLTRTIYEKFIINFFNRHGLESRVDLVPKGIYYVEEINYVVKVEPEEDYFNNYKTEILAIDRNGLKSVLHEYIDKDYEKFPIVEKESKKYIRFEYKYSCGDRLKSEWLHVIKEGKEWY